MNYEICVIGNEALLFPFLQFGFTTFAPESTTDLRHYLHDVIQKNYGIIYIQDSYCFSVEDILDKYRDRLTPIFIPIGENEEAGSYARQTAREMMEKAIGQNIL